MIGVGEYDKGIFPCLPSVELDYYNVKYSLNYLRGYSIIYQTTNNNLKYLNYNSHINKINDNFKMRWTVNEMKRFFQKCKQTCESSLDTYDSLICFIACHGDCNDIIFDSEGEELELKYIYNLFDNKHFEYLQNKPKLFVIDACRGNLVMRRFKNSLVDQENDKMEEKIDENSDEKCNDEKKMQWMPNNASISNLNAMIVNDNDNEKYVENSDMYKIYANVPNFAIVDAHQQSNYLIRSFTTVIANDEIFKTCSFGMIMLCTRQIMHQLMGNSTECASQVIEEITTMTKNFYFG